MFKFDSNGLIPAIAQDARSGEILMVAYMNQEALQRTLEIGQAVFWSRSRQEIWHKGATSGNFLRVRRLFTDCDNDTILMLVEPMGPACHTGRTSCFFKELDCPPGQPARLRETGEDEPLPLAGAQSHMSKDRTTLLTWAGRKQFQYKGSVRQGTTIYCGDGFRYAFRVTANEYASTLTRFSEQEVSIGTSRTDPPNGSLGKWLTEEYNHYGMASYVGPILISEGFAERGSKPDRIQIKRFSR